MCLSLFFAVNGYSQTREDLKQNENGRFERSQTGYYYNGPEFGGRIHVGPEFRHTNPQALQNENNGIAHGVNLCFFNSCNSSGEYNRNATKGKTTRFHKKTKQMNHTEPSL
jgi:hypothetical protein